MKDIVTSYFGKANELKRHGYTLVVVSRGLPRWFEEEYIDFKLVAPTWEMLHMAREHYDCAYQKILDGLNAQSIYDMLPGKCALLCFEKYPKWCHRRMLAEWLEMKCGLEITEFGIARKDVVPYKNMGENIIEPRVESYRQESLF